MLRAIAITALLFGCGGNGVGKPQGATIDRAETHAHPAPSSVAEPASRAGAELKVALRVEASPDGVGLYVANAGSERIELARAVALEKKAGDAFAPVSPEALALRFDCRSTGCVPLAPGSELAAPSWLGRIGGERCDALAKLEPGEYRFVVRACSLAPQAEVRFTVAASP